LALGAPPAMLLMLQRGITTGSPPTTWPWSDHG